MKQLPGVLCLCALVATSVIAAGPDITIGSMGVPFVSGPQREVCQWGFSDDAPGSGWTLGLGQQLGIMCTLQNSEITGVGAYFEFIVTPGTCNIVIYDDGVQVHSTGVQPVAGVNEFEISHVQVDGDVCVMFCEVGSFWAVLGEDYSSPPYGNSYWSDNCTCQNAFGDNNLTVWVTYTPGIPPPNPAEELSWGKVRMLYR